MIRMSCLFVAGAVLSLAPALESEAQTRRARTRPQADSVVIPPLREEVAAQLRDRALQGTEAYRLVEGITTLGPRLAGTDAERRAAEWGAAALKRLGFENVRIESFPLHVWERGEERVEVLGERAQPLVATALGGSPATPAGGIEGEIVLFETWQDLLDDAPGSLTGKVAVVLQDTPRTQTGSGYGSTNAMRGSGPVEAAKRGAVGYLLRSLGTHDHRFAHTGATRYDPAAVPSFALSPPDADQLRRLAKLGPVRVRLFSTARSLGVRTSQNVIAEVVGREKPEEVIVIGGHLDSWDQGTGAVDDASGIGITTAAAKLIRDLAGKPRRTIRVVWFGAEEVPQPTPMRGLAGAWHYTETRRAALANHVAGSESDFGAGPIYSVGLPAGAGGPAFRREAARVLAPLGVLFDPAPATGGGPDMTYLAQAGVPMFRLNQDGTDYFDVHHTPDDVIDRVDAKSLDQNVAAWAALLWLIADSDVDFRAKPPVPAT